MTTAHPIGILDSGVGGLSILRAVRRLMPQLDIVYYADTAHFPYGEKSADTIRQLVRIGIMELRRAGCHTIILACNTASTISLADYQSDTEATILGVTPLLGQAAATTETGKIIVLATFGTLASDYYQQIQNSLPDNLTVYTQACFDWVRLVETGHLEDDGLIAEQVKTFARHGIDTVVLGCTHFAFLETTIRRAAPGMHIIEPGATIARQLQQRLGTATGGGTTRYIVTGNEARFVARASVLLKPISPAASPKRR
jgi:glutamate racemase